MTLEARGAVMLPPSPNVQALESVLARDSLILDMGAFQGRNGAYLTALGHRVISVEKTFDATLAGKTINPLAGDGFICGDLREPMFADETFDIVICNYVLQEIPKSEAITAIRGLQKLTRPGGINLIEAYTGTQNQQRDVPSLNLYPPGSLSSLYGDAGWDIIGESELFAPLVFAERTNGELKITVDSKAMVLAKKPRKIISQREDLLRQADHYRRIDTEYSDHLRQMADQLE
jgi:SAM-dependent methyltransferase